MKSLLFLFLLLTSCGVFHPIKFNNLSLNEKLVDVKRESIQFSEVLKEAENQKKTLIHIYASYCPFSQKSREDVVKLQSESNNFNYISLSVDHSYHDWKRELKNIPIKGKHYYLSSKDKGALGNFLKLKKVPRFLILDEEDDILIFKSSNLSKLKRKLK